MSGWLSRLKAGLSRSSSKLVGGIGGIFTGRRKLDQATLDELEDLLITSDLGVTTSAKLIARLSRDRFDAEVSATDIQANLAAGIAEILAPIARPLTPDPAHRPHVVLVAGVNGAGKTTTIGKLAHHFRAQGLSVMLAAGDTFRAAAIEQLQVWGERTGCNVIAKQIGSDAAALAFEAVEQARAQQTDVLLIDTAGRLQNKDELMAELEKVVRVIKKVDDSAPHDCILVLDATVGQNAHSQVETFGRMVNVSGLVMTKLDGSAKGGVVVSLAEKFNLPVIAIGVGEGIEDLQAFDAESFARNLVGLDTA